MNPLQIVYSAVALALIGAAGYYVWSCEDAKEFQAKAVILANEAKVKAEKETKRLQGAKEKVDAELKKLRADNLSLDKRLRDANADRRRMSVTRTLTSSPERATFNGAILDAAVKRYLEETSGANQQLDAELFGIVGEGQDHRSALDSAKDWAKAIQYSLDSTKDWAKDIRPRE